MNGMLDLPPLVGMKICVNPESYKNYDYKDLIKGSGRIVDLAGLSQSFFQGFKKRIESGETPSAYTGVLFDNGQKFEIYYKDMLLLDEPCTNVEAVKISGYDEITISTKEDQLYVDTLIINKGKNIINKWSYNKSWRLENLYGCGDSEEAKDYIERNI